MRFQTKLLIAYMTIVVIVVTVITFIFYWYNAEQLRETVYSNLKDTADRMAQQIDYQIIYMDSTMEHVMSSKDFMDAIEVRGGPAPQDLLDNQEAVKASRTITSALYLYPLNKFYRVNYFNKNYDFFTSRFDTRDTKNKGSAEILAEMDWLDKVDEIQPNRYISVLHKDPWLIREDNQVFSVIRNIRIFSVDAGYLEVQMEFSELLEMLNINDDDKARLILLTPGGEILFQNLNGDQSPESYLDNPRESAENVVVSEDKKEAIASALCSYSKMRILLIQDQETLLAPLAAIGRSALLIGLVVLSVAFFSVYTWSIQLTKPIRTLREEMERIKLSDFTKSELQIPVPDDRSTGKDDIKALNNAFYSLCQQLSVSIQNEMEARALQVQASFDSLQAQINPHFLYNVLNVISNRGLNAGDESICDICACIAEMLRYSTSTQSKTATIADEIAHVNNYLTLLQMRYKHRLRYTIEVAQDLMMYVVPKIVLQPFVENSISHGFKKGNREMMLSLTGQSTGGGWFLEIRDNGSGFDEQALENIRASLDLVDTRLMTGKENVRFSLGGMGLAATYARLKMFLPDIRLSFGNNPEGGAFVRIEV